MEKENSSKAKFIHRRDVLFTDEEIQKLREINKKFSLPFSTLLRFLLTRECDRILEETKKLEGPK